MLQEKMWVMLVQKLVCTGTLGKEEKARKLNNT